MKIRIIAIGKIKDKYLQDGIETYTKRLKKYVDLSIVEVNDSKVKEHPNESDIKKAIDSEGELVLKILKPTDYVIGLDLNKKEMDSENFAIYLNNSLEKSGSFLTFVIGGSYGLSNDLKARLNDSFSLSKMTFLHQMTRLILLEQIYRGFKILYNETYHK